jgi:hypothetical protein
LPSFAVAVLEILFQFLQQLDSFFFSVAGGFALQYYFKIEKSKVILKKGKL